MGEISPALYRAGSGEPLLLLHGFTGAWHHWRPVLGELVARYEVIAPTLAGHDGGPPYTLDAPLTFPAATDSLERRLDELGVDSVHVVGNSLGGALGLELAKRGRALSVLAMAPAGGWTEGDGEAQRLSRFFARQLRLARAVGPRMVSLARRPVLRRLALRDIMRHGELVSPADAVDLARSALRCTIAQLALGALRADRGLALRDLDRIDRPVLLASPQFDRVLPPERHAPRLRREIPGAQSRVLAGCGHVPMWDDTRLVVRTVCEWVDGHAGGARRGPASAANFVSPRLASAPG